MCSYLSAFHYELRKSGMKSTIFQIILLAVFGALAVAGILIFAFAVGTDKNANVIGPVLIWGTLDKPTFDDVLENIVLTNQALSGVSYVQKDGPTFDQELASAISEKRGPDLYIIASDDAVKNENRVTILDYGQITRQQYQDAFAEATNPFLSQRGVIAIPFLVDPLLLYWNRDLLGSAGFAEPPVTWDQVPGMVRAITVKDTTGSIRRSGIALGTFPNIENGKAIITMLMIQAANVGNSVPEPIVGHNQEGLLISTMGSSFGRESPPALDALRFYTEFANPAQSDYSWNNSLGSARSAFAQGQVGLYLGFSSENALVRAMNPNLNFSFSSIPQLPSSVRLITYGRAYAFAVPLESRNAQGAFMVADLFATATTSAAFARAFGMASASRAALNTGEGREQTIINKMALIAKNWTDPDPQKTNAIFRDMIGNVISGAGSITDALSNADQQLGHLMKQ